ncbi:STAS/SEC14 domain-containing protein [candidate division WOR-3 bacterium]|nr:STAS/SEC14 domain-containing protein [candidate division WOR-3 bacterium]
MEKYILSYDDKDNILYLKILGVMEIENIRELMPRFNKMFEGKPRRYALVDMSESVQMDTSVMTKEMRDAYKELGNMMDADKAAIVGATPVLRMIAKIVIAITRRAKTTQFFKTKEDAVSWMKGDKN